MHIAIVGAGALGLVYGVRLAGAGERVTFVVRPARVAETSPFTIELASGAHARSTLEAPERAAGVPEGADVVLLCVRAEQLDDSLGALLAEAPGALVVALTPLLPAEFERVERSCRGRLAAAQPGVVSYHASPEVVRYWTPRVAPTLVDASAPDPEGAKNLVAALVRAGLPARLEAGVRTSNPATTVTFFPLVLALDAAGGTVEKLMSMRERTSDAFAAVRETEKLASRLGQVAPWAGMLTKFVGPVAVRVGLRLARAASPEAIRFVEVHFGVKTHAQNVVMARQIVDLARQHGIACPAFSRLLARTAQRG